MNLRKTTRLALVAFAAVFVTPFLQSPATKLAERLGFDQYFSDRWESLISRFFELSHNSWYVFLAGCGVGSASGFWFTFLFSGNNRSGAKQNYRETRLKLKADPAGSKSMLQHSSKNIDSWQHLIFSMSQNGDLIHLDTIVMSFSEDLDYSRPIIDTFGHKMGGYNFYSLGKKGAAFQFFDGVQVPLIEIWFPPPNYYDSPPAI